VGVATPGHTERGFDAYQTCTRDHFFLHASCTGRGDAVARQGLRQPLIGYDFGGNSGCPQINNCEDKRTNFGVAIGTMGKILGFEEELADAKNFCGCVGTQSHCMRMSVAKVRVGEGQTRRICARVGEGFPDILHGDGHSPRAWNTNCHRTRRPRILPPMPLLQL
jgi:hypothetical protein